MQILPAILAEDESEFIAKVERVRALGLPLHVDVMDGIFVPGKTWAPPGRVREILAGIPFEAHLMVSDPEHAVPVWVATAAERVIFHTEATTHQAMICRAVEADCARLTLAVNPNTPVADIVPYLELYRHIMIMGVTPGASGQPFQEHVLRKVEELRRLRPGATVTIDGGMSPATCAAAKAAGASRIIAGSALTDAPDPVIALESFQKALV